ncbi:MAG: HD domain-containing protein [Candidatus Omnitrophica bacterium]|nr:HD domain-containing protein [Candidatus Omnitrophota bacterium]
MSKKPRMTSFEKSSLISQFNIFFVLFSVIPLGVLYYFYRQLTDSGKIEITIEDFRATLTLVVLGIAVGYFAMNMVFRKLLRLIKSNQSALQNFLDDDKMGEIQSNNNEVAVLTKTFSEIRSKLEQNVEKLEMAKNTLQSVLAKVGEGISSVQNIDAFLELIVETLVDAVGAKSGALLFLDSEATELNVRTVLGENLKIKRNACFKVSESIFKSVIESRENLIISQRDSAAFKLTAKHDYFEFPLVCAPLLVHDKVLGIIVICGRKFDTNFTHDDASLLTSIATQTAIAVENDQLNLDAEKTYFDIISALALAVEAKDPYSRGHLDRVSDYSLKIAEKFGLTDDEKKLLRDAARLHDLGKIGITDDILCKNGPLTEQEWVVMRNHPEIGEGIVKSVKSLSGLCDIVRHHHEKLDGTGYPDGLKGDEISLLVRILAVADICDALMTNRPYRRALSAEETKKTLKEMGDKVDQKIVDALASIL